MSDEGTISKLNELHYVAYDEYYAQQEKLFPRARRPVGGAWNCKAAFRKAFAKLAKTCLENDIDVREYVSAMFPVVRAKARCMHPSDFNEDWVLEEFRRMQRGRLTELPASYWGLFTARVTQIRAMGTHPVTDMEIMMKAALPFPAWFRVMFPAPPLDADLLRSYAEPAWNELRQDRKLRDFLRTERPANFRALELRVCAFGDGD